MQCELWIWYNSGHNYSEINVIIILHKLWALHLISALGFLKQVIFSLVQGSCSEKNWLQWAINYRDVWQIAMARLYLCFLVQKLVIRFREIQSFSGQFKPCNTENYRLHFIRIYHAQALDSSRTLALLSSITGIVLLGRYVVRFSRDAHCDTL